jgi:Tfp pilus assembly protein PilF
VRKAPAVFAALLITLVVLVFAQTAGFSFINFDDDYYVSNNPAVRKGLSAESVAFAFSIRNGFYWHPLTWLTLMAENSAAGLNPAVHHATNVLLHAAAVVFVFLFLHRTTGYAGRAAAAAALFALHPLRAESVAWIAERKDVLFGCFAGLAFLLYARYVERRTPRRYAGFAAAVIAALMSKPAAVTLPMLLLIADYWPLGRTDRWGVLIREKLPLFACAVIVAALTWIGQEAAGALALTGQIPFHVRILKSSEWLWGYLSHTFWPVGLVIPYPYDPSPGNALWYWFATAAVTVVAFVVRRSQPYVFAGWLWFVTALLPSLGFVQAGGQSMADRFTYLPHVGFFAGLVWLAAEKLPLNAFRYGTAAAVLAAAWTCAAQVSLWRDSESLFRHTVEHTPDNWVARLKLGSALVDKGRYRDAEPHLREAVRRQPGSFHTHYNLGRALAALGSHTEAASAFERTIVLKPAYADAHYSLGAMLLQTGHPQTAEPALRQAISLGVDSRYLSEAHNLLGASIAQQGRIAEALAEFETAARTDPANENARRNLDTARRAIAVAPGTPAH